jgi:hypothetical protein
MSPGRDWWIPRLLHPELTTQKQYVEIGTKRSPEAEVGRSCVQGSVLGPTLWLIYVNSLLVRLEAAGVDVHAYADDVSIIKHIETDAEKEEFELILEILLTWAKDFNMIWNPLKTQRLVFKHRGCREPCPPRVIHFNGDQIIPMDSKSLKTKCESLGVLISKNLIFLDHINRVTNSIKSMTTLMNRNF